MSQVEREPIDSPTWREKLQEVMEEPKRISLALAGLSFLVLVELSARTPLSGDALLAFRFFTASTVCNIACSCISKFGISDSTFSSLAELLFHVVGPCVFYLGCCVLIRTVDPSSANGVLVFGGILFVVQAFHANAKRQKFKA